MGKTTNVTILIPGRKIYCDYRLNMVDIGNDKMSGQWSIIDFMPTPLRKDYSKLNTFPYSNGDAFLDKGLYPGYHLYFFPPGYLSDPVLALFNAAFVAIEMDVKQNIFSPGKASWAKKAQIIPSNEEATAIFWQ